MITVPFVVVVDTRTPWLPKWLEQKLTIKVLWCVNCTNWERIDFS